LPHYSPVLPPGESCNQDRGNIDHPTSICDHDIAKSHWPPKAVGLTIEPHRHPRMLTRNQRFQGP
jgi:hypothetical protein